MVSKYKDNTPGPGAYQHFSQFGIWVPKTLTNGYNVRKRLNSANKFNDNVKNYEYNSREKSGRIVSALR